MIIFFSSYILLWLIGLSLSDRHTHTQLFDKVSIITSFYSLQIPQDTWRSSLINWTSFVNWVCIWTFCWFICWQTLAKLFTTGINNDVSDDWRCFTSDNRSFHRLSKSSITRWNELQKTLMFDLDGIFD